MSIENNGAHKVIVYIDGFNCYFGLKESQWQCYYWLDYAKLAHKLASKIMAENPTLVATKYFTARISAPEDKRRRQTTFLEALEAHSDTKFYYGHYRENKYSCSGCGRPNFVPNEKQTDVNIAVNMVVDAVQDNFDTAILIGGDSDLIPPVETIKRLYPHKRVIACFPPNRHSKHLRKVCNGQIHLSESDFKNNQLPETVRRKDGYTLERPQRWNK